MTGFSNQDISHLFNLQVEKLIRLNYPKMMGIGTQFFREQLSGLRHILDDIPRNDTSGNDYIPFVLVINDVHLTLEKTFSLIGFNGNNGIISMDPVNPADFKPISGTVIPEGIGYLLIDIDRGGNTLNITPKEALLKIIESGRNPITINEGIAILTQYPEFLEKNHCFSLLASRKNDKRVPALWLSDGKPKLGWCWEGNPHTWLGSASCRRRIGITT